MFGGLGSLVCGRMAREQKCQLEQYRQLHARTYFRRPS